jgi:sigma-B regulation protein RsbU (phosphoserine phosphatase)
MPAAIVSLSLVAAGSLSGVIAWSVIRSRRMPAPVENAGTAGPSDDTTNGAFGVAGLTDSAEDADARRLGKLYRSVFQSVADALVVIDDHGIIRSFSPSAQSTFGYEMAEVVGHNVSILMPPPDRDHHEEYLREYVDSGWSSGRMETLVLTGDAHIIRPERETVAVRKDGTLFPARLIVSEVESDGNRLFVGLISDVSERKRLESELAAQVKSQGALLEELRDAYAVIEGQRQRMQYELDVGREIQLSMVPHRFPRMARADMWAALRPAREVGGDFYDFFTTQTGLLWMCVGDVSGKGVPAALLMAVTKTLVNSSAARGSTPGEVLTQVNAELSRDNESSMFVTAFVVALDLQSGLIRYANAGHNPPLVRRASSRTERLDGRHGPVLGALDGACYAESVARLDPGDVLLLFTDGVTEALDPEGQLFTEARLRDTLSNDGVASAEGAARAVVAAVDSFAAGAEQADDITVLALRFIGDGPSTPETHFRFRVLSRFDSLATAAADVEDSVGRCGGSVVTQRRFALAFDELLSNIIKYAYSANEGRVIECEVARRGGAIEAVITDNGVPFNPLELSEPDTALSLETREIGGLGVLLVREMFDDVRYERRDSRNITTIVQRLTED